jgi:hypothetical protein
VKQLISTDVRWNLTGRMIGLLALPGRRSGSVRDMQFCEHTRAYFAVIVFAAANFGKSAITELEMEVFELFLIKELRCFTRSPKQNPLLQ